MLTGDEIRERLRCLPDRVAMRVLAELAEDRVYEAERLTHPYVGQAAGDELVASLVRAQIAGGPRC